MSAARSKPRGPRELEGPVRGGRLSLHTGDSAEPAGRKDMHKELERGMVRE